MKPQSTQSSQPNRIARLDDSARCVHRTPSGRRCKLPIEAAGKLLCYAHGVELKKSDVLNLKTALLTGSQGFQTAQGINFALSNLYKLLANNYISPRRASVLAYISSLLLRTLPAIDADLAAGIRDPTAPSAQAGNQNEQRDEAKLAPAASPKTSPSAPDSFWDPSLPNPDPTKKPS
ncbi:MAG: hypothetical protein WA857_17265 [Candidatus Acidiferrum sp.]